MTTSEHDVRNEGRYVQANGTDIYYVEAGQGKPLLLLHGGVVSTNPVWAGHPRAYVSHMQTFAEHLRVIAPETRGHGRTVNAGGGSILYPQLADDVVALIDALGLDRPMICGFSDGAMTATIVGIRNPGAVRAIVNHAGFYAFNPQAPGMAMMRQNLGGSPDATQADPDVIARAFDSSEQMRAMFELVKADHDGAQGPGYWRTHFAEAFDRLTQPPGYTVEDLGKITAPTLILTGDRDEFSPIEEGVGCYRALEQGELAVMPNHAHLISPSAVRASIEFLERHQRGGQQSPAASG
jgi:pimeloyl-ACP methyl ester carboxylesterase